MQAAKELELVSVADYLAGERDGQQRHEFVGGMAYAMAGASKEHNTIAGNLFAALHAHLHGARCRVFMADVKVRAELAHKDIFYYPDVAVACDARDTDRYFIRYPKVLIEVLSDDTAHVDRREKFLTYTQIETLEEYVLVDQGKMEVTVFRRAANWAPAVAHQPEQQLQLASLEFSLPLSAVYESVNI